MNDVDAIAERLGPRTTRNASMGSLTTLRVGGAAELLVRAESEDDLLAVAELLGDTTPAMVVGQGSNLLVGDHGVAGVVIVLDGPVFSDWSVVDRSDTVRVRTGGAVKLPVLARQSVADSLTGLEWMVGVPGSVGGAVRMNAGGHGSDVASSLVEARVLDLRAATITVRPPSVLGLSYRHSNLEAHELVLGAEFELAEGSRIDGERELSEIVRWRRENQPGGANCGSVFTNPPGDSAGRLIDAAGLKGHRVGSAAVSVKHANFIQADDGARASDVWALVVEVRAKVFERFGVVLAPEVRTVGFDATLPELGGRAP